MLRWVHRSLVITLKLHQTDLLSISVAPASSGAKMSSTMRLRSSSLMRSSPHACQVGPSHSATNVLMVGV